jgi:hypothetical protein
MIEKEHIEMYTKATELQAAWNPAIGDRRVRISTRDRYIGTVGTDGDERKYKDEYIWIPTQEQLQEMLLKTCTVEYLIASLHKFYNPENTCPDSDSNYSACNKCIEIGTFRRTSFLTMDLIWLAFTMDELYGKKWNGTEWIIV